MANKLVNREIVKSSPRSVFLLSGMIDTAESGVTKIDISALPGAPSRIRIVWIKASVSGCSVLLSYDRAVGGDAVVIADNIEMNEPIEDNGTGAGTGDLKLSTLDLLTTAGGRGYTILLCIEEKS